MKMNDVKNKKVVSALMIGISAMMALQTPITAYASGDGSEAPAPDNSSSEAPAPTTQSEPQAVQDAGNAVAEANEAIEASVGTQTEAVETSVVKAVAAQEVATPEAPAPDPATLIEVQANSAAAIADDVASSVISGAAEIAADTSLPTPNANSTAEINELVDAATEVQNDTGFEDGAAKMIEAKQDAQEASDAYKEADAQFEKVQSESKTALESLQQYSVAAENMSEDVSSIKDTADDLLDTINDSANKDDVDAAFQNISAMIDLIDTITDENAADADLAQACNDLAILVENDDVKTLAADIKLYDTLKQKYDDAIAELTAANEKLSDAEDLFNTKADSALAAAQQAEADVTAAKDKVDALSAALAKVEGALNEEGQAKKLGDAKKTKNGIWDYSSFTDTEKRREVMMNVVVNYYIPQILGENIITSSEDPNLMPDWNLHDNPGKKNTPIYTGADNQEYHYTMLTYHYYDDDGNIQTATRYFNWDGLTKATDSSTGDFWSNTNANSKDGIVIFEKSEEEILANKYLEEVYTAKYGNDDNPLKKNQDAIKAESMSHNLTVFKFTDKEGKEQMISGLELNTPEYLEERGITKDSSGAYHFTGEEAVLDLTEIVQNNNNLLHQANCLILGGEPSGQFEDKINKHTRRHDAADYKNNQLPTSRMIWEHIDAENAKLESEGLNPAEVENTIEKNLAKSVANSFALRSYIDTVSANANDVSSVAKKYEAYYSTTQKAKVAAEKAEAEAKDLTNAITKLQGNKTNRNALATTVLGTTDIATYFNLGITDEAEKARLNSLSVNALITELNQLRDDANTKATQAKKTLADLKNTDLNGLKAQIDARFPAPTGGGGGGTSGGGGATTVDPGVTTPTTDPIITITPAATTITPTFATIADQAAPTAPNPAAPVVNQAGGAGAAIGGGNAAGDMDAQADAADNTAIIEEEEAARAATPEVAVDEAKQPAPDQAFTILEEDSAKAATFDATEPAKKMSWWWLLIIAILGATGKEMYRRHLEKEEAKNNDNNNPTDF
ncbi:MAG: hypothetical protein IJJ64_11495 [Butyrivibrio sp.]|nr:hypothetical protein [Butyrivibrio sp.]